MARSRGPVEEPTRAEGARSKLVSGSSGNVHQLLADDDDPDVDTASNSSSSADPHRPATEPLPESERPFGRYTLLRRLAYGGMGEIFLARQGGVGSLSAVAKLVVIKRILGHMKRDDKHRRMFLDEARLQAVLANPHIVQIYDMGEENGHVYLAMEHVHGPSWRALIDRCRKNREHIPLAHIANMMAQAARGLSYAHNLVDVTGARLRIVHRDINPHNILVSYDGEVKVIDFGIAKSDLADGNTETGTIKGKFSYMSPEQSAADPLDARSDIFTLGICLYELCTLENPFRKSNVVLSLESIQRDEPPPLGKKRRDAAMFQAVVDRCLAKNRDDRFDDCADIATALEALLASGVVPDPPEPLNAWLKRRFQGEIAEHVHILEQTGSTSAVVVASRSDPGLKTRKPPSSRVSGELRVDPNALTRSVVMPDPAPAGEFTAMPGAPEGEPVLVEQTSQTPAESYDVSAISRISVVADKPEAPRRTRAPLVAAAVFLIVVFGVAAGVGLAFAIEPVQAHAILDHVVARLDRAPPPVVAELPPPPPAVVDKPPVAFDPPKDDPPKDDPPKQEAPKEEPPADAPGDAAALPEGSTHGGAVEKPPAGDDTRAVAHTRVKEPREAREPKEREIKEKEPAKEAVAGVSVTSEGFAVKGSRKVFAGEATLLTIDKADGAPLGVKFRVREASFDVESEPWAIVRVDGLGKGKTPQKSIPLQKGRAVSVELVNPTAGKMVVTLKLTAK